MHGKLDHAQKTFAQTLLQNNVLHMDAFIHKGFDKQEPLSHTPMPLHTNVLIHRSFCAQELTQRKSSHTHKCFYTENFCTHNSFTLRKLLHAKALTHRKRSHSDGFFYTNSFYTQKFLHTHTHLLHIESFCTHRFLHTENLWTLKRLHTESLYTQKGFTHKHYQTLIYTGSFTHKNSFTRTFTHKYIYTQTASTHRHRQLLHTETSEVLSGKKTQVEQTNLLRLEAQWEFWIL